MISSVVITGASQGIGAAIAKTFAGQVDEEGNNRFHLGLIARNATKLHSVSEHCRNLGAEVECFVHDLADETSVIAMEEAVTSRFGTPELLINNAGKFVRGDLATMTLADFRSTMDSNLTSAFLVTRAFLPQMIARESGSIFYMASVASERAYPDNGAYTVAKHGLLGLARSVRESTRKYGLRVTAIMPGATESPSWDDSGVSSNALMPADDIAKAVLSIYNLSLRSVVEEIVLRPVAGDV